MKFQNTLPEIPIPLAEPNEDVPIDLGMVVADVYERGGYATLIDYNRQPPPPQLGEEDAKWVDALLRSKGFALR
ncbi:DUF4058 family protein [Chloroflexi bacterium TSY]|nr:DUF4058 family protein [Chloroflexi bacterium TSY]